MASFLLYDGKVAVALLVFYLFNRFLLKKETFHRFNRVVLVGTTALSFLLPLCIITIRKPAEPGVLVMEMTEEMRELAPVVSVEDTFPSWPVLLAIVLFWAGAAFVLVRVIVSMLSILKIVRQGELMREEDGCKIVVTDRDIDPFSWMKYIVLSRKDWDGNHAPILLHEKAHISYCHSVELLLVDLLSVLQWFNPAIWMLRADLRELHEYEADDAVLRAGTDIKEYQYLLIRKAVGKSGYSVANSFNHSILKNRITMMSKSKSPLSRGLRVLYLLPLVCLGIGLQAKTVYVPVDKDSNNILADERNPDNPEKTVTIKIESDGRIIIDGKETPLKEIAGYLRSLDVPVQDLQFNVDTENAPAEAIKDFQEYFALAFDPDPDTKRIVHVDIDAKGNVTVEGKDVAKKDILSHFHSLDTPAKDMIVQMQYDNDTPRDVVDDVVNVLRQAGVLRVQVAAMAQMVDTGNPPLCILRDAWGMEEKEITYEESYEIGQSSRLRSVERLDAAQAKAKYGEKGANGAVIYTMKRPQELDEIVVVSYAEEDDGPIPFMLANPDTLPLFQGEGMDAFSRWLNVRIHRPKGCTHEGDMKVSFVVGTDGAVSDIKVTQSVCESLDAMVLSIIEQSPKWVPATAGGHPVAQCLTIPLSFKMRLAR